MTLAARFHRIKNSLAKVDGVPVSGPWSLVCGSLFTARCSPVSVEIVASETPLTVKTVRNVWSVLIVGNALPAYQLISLNVRGMTIKHFQNDCQHYVS